MQDRQAVMPKPLELGDDACPLFDIVQIGLQKPNQKGLDVLLSEPSIVLRQQPGLEDLILLRTEDSIDLFDSPQQVVFLDVIDSKAHQVCQDTVAVVEVPHL